MNNLVQKNTHNANVDYKSMFLDELRANLEIEGIFTPSNRFIDIWVQTFYFCFKNEMYFNHLKDAFKDFLINKEPYEKLNPASIIRRLKCKIPSKEQIRDYEISKKLNGIMKKRAEKFQKENLDWFIEKYNKTPDQLSDEEYLNILKKIVNIR